MSAVRSRRRLAACASACRGIPTDALESGALHEALRLARAALVLQQAAELIDLPLARRALDAIPGERR